MTKTVQNFSLALMFSFAMLNGHAAEAKHHRKTDVTDQQWYAIEQKFYAWKPAFKLKAKADHVSQRTLDTVLGPLTPSRDVINYERAQPESLMTYEEHWQKSIVHLIKPGRDLLAKDRDKIIAAEEAGSKVLASRPLETITHLDVEPAKLIAIEGIESTFGTGMGDINGVQAAATLAAAGHENKKMTRHAMFEKELLIQLHQIDRGEVSPHMLTSWADAQGVYQFEPSTRKLYGIDADGDGRVTLDDPKKMMDAWASAANKMKHDGYVAGEHCGWHVRLPDGFTKDEMEAGPKRTLNEWADLGLEQYNGAQLPHDDSYPFKLMLLGNTPKDGQPDRREPVLADDEVIAGNKWNLGWFTLDVCNLSAAIEAPAP